MEHKSRLVASNGQSKYRNLIWNKFKVKFMVNNLLLLSKIDHPNQLNINLNHPRNHIKYQSLSSVHNEQVSKWFQT